jgi:ABC-type dipeptide/oligopeptide/nickel transport system permease subunit
MEKVVIAYEQNGMHLNDAARTQVEGTWWWVVVVVVVVVAIVVALLSVSTGR